MYRPLMQTFDARGESKTTKIKRIVNNLQLTTKITVNNSLKYIENDI